MQAVIKNIAIAMGVLIISAGIFYAVSDDSELKELKEDVFNHSLKLLGSQLLAMIPNDDHSGEVAQRWEIFQEKALKGLPIITKKILRLRLILLKSICLCLLS